MNTQSNRILDGSVIFKLKNEVADTFSATTWYTPEEAAQGTIVYRGQLLMADPEKAYDTIADRWRSFNYTPLLRKIEAKPDLEIQSEAHSENQPENQVELIANPGIIIPKSTNPWINLILFIITLITVIIVGALNEGVDLRTNPMDFVQGLPFAFAFLGILAAHEFGHYFAARYYKLDVTLPYFIPFPTIWGTLGAVILFRSPAKTNKQLFDVGVAGPLAGLVVAVVVLIIGLLRSNLQPLPVGEPYILEGNSIFYWLLKFFIFGQALPSADGMDVFLDPLAWAGWSGLFVTMINLLPVGQLDGGHVVYVLFGRYARLVGYIIFGLLAVLGLIFWPGWLFMGVLFFFMVGVGHPPPLNELAPLGSGRKILGYMMILTFFLLFMPAPLEIMGM